MTILNTTSIDCLKITHSDFDVPLYKLLDNVSFNTSKFETKLMDNMYFDLCYALDGPPDGCYTEEGIVKTYSNSSVQEFKDIIIRDQLRVIKTLSEKHPQKEKVTLRFLFNWYIEILEEVDDDDDSNGPPILQSGYLMDFYRQFSVMQLIDCRWDHMYSPFD